MNHEIVVKELCNLSQLDMDAASRLTLQKYYADEQRHLSCIRDALKTVS